MLKIHSGYECYNFSAEFEHPDNSPMYKEVVIECTQDEDGVQWEDFLEDVAKVIWDKYNDSGFYHTMTLTHEVYWNNNRFTYLCDYNGVELSNFRQYHMQYKED